MRMMLATLLLSLTALGTAHAQGSQALATAPVSYQAGGQDQEFDGVIEAVNKSTVSAQTSGRITEINFDVDDYVEKGAVLLRMRATEQKAAARAATARFATAEADWKRMQELYAKKLVSKAMYDQSQAQYEAARAAMEQAGEGEANTVVRAPYSGIVVERHIQVGELANVGQPLMTGVSLDALRATANVPEVYIAKVRALKRAQVTLANGQTIQGGEVTISPTADPQTHTFKVRVALPRGARGVYPGNMAKVSFGTGEARRLLVPTSTVVYRSEVTAVYVVKPDGKVGFRQIRPGAVFGDSIEVLAGLEDGEKVALDPIRAGIVLKAQRAGDKQ
jgi:RND family efflux transporter MFP subunit